MTFRQLMSSLLNVKGVSIQDIYKNKSVEKYTTVMKHDIASI